MYKLLTIIRQTIKKYRSIYLFLRTLRVRLRCFTQGLRHVDKTAYLAAGSKLSRDIVIGSYAYVGPDAMLCPGVTIGAYSMLGPRVTVVGRDHRFDLPGVPIIFSGRPEAALTVIEEDVWIGACSTLIAGVRIGRGSVVAAGSVVVQDVPSFCIVAGVPARLIRARFDEKGVTIHENMLNGQIADGAFCPDVKGI